MQEIAALMELVSLPDVLVFIRVKCELIVPMSLNSGLCL